MGKLLFFAILGVALYFLVKSALRSRVRPPPDATRTTQNEVMVTCARCGVNMPRDAATARDERWVCADNPNCR